MRDIVFGALLVLAALLTAKRAWMAAQAKRRIRDALADRSMILLKIRQAAVWRECGSVRSAFLTSLRLRDYDVRGRTSEGTERMLSATADFHPVSGTLRHMDISDAH